MAIQKEGRLGYLDNVRTAMTVLVLVVHAAITYGSEGGWYYQEPVGDMLTVVPLTLISAVSQSFFMSLLFFVAAYFTSISIGRKGPARFVGGRLLRLGVPYLLFAFGVGPLTLLFTLKFLDNEPFVYGQSIHVGPLWFVQTLLLFTSVYVIIQLLRRKSAGDSAVTSNETSAPTLKWLAWLGVLMSALTFFARWAYPIGTGYWGMQFGSFPQYIVMFVLGIAAQKRNWLEKLRDVRVKPLSVCIALCILALPVAMFLGADPEYGFEYFLGGPYWQAVVYAIWESVMCVFMSLLVLSVFQRRTDGSSRISRFASKSAFGVYIIHPVILIAGAVVLSGVQIHPLVKFVILVSAGTALSFLIASGLRKLPGLNRVL